MSTTERRGIPPGVGLATALTLTCLGIVTALSLAHVSFGVALLAGVVGEVVAGLAIRSTASWVHERRARTAALHAESTLITAWTELRAQGIEDDVAELLPHLREHPQRSRCPDCNVAAYCNACHRCDCCGLEDAT